MILWSDSIKQVGYKIKIIDFHKNREKCQDCFRYILSKYFSEIMHAAVQSGTNVRSQSPKNLPSSNRQTSLVAKNKKSAYGTLHTEHQIEVNIHQKTGSPVFPPLF